MARHRRPIDGHEPTHRFPTGFRKSLVLFNLHRVPQTGTRTVLVVEGFFDALAVYHAGYPAVVALIGSTLSKSQADWLTTSFDRVLLMLDGVDTGRQSAVASALAGRIDLIPIRLDDGTQADQLPAPTIRRLAGGLLGV